jgi:hypothetical protein
MKKFMALAAALAFSTAALADFTTITDATAGSESQVWDILNDILGGTYSQDDVNGVGSFDGSHGRLTDFDGGGFTNTFLTDGTTAAQFTGIFWGGAGPDGSAAHRFGYRVGGVDSAPLFDIPAGTDPGTVAPTVFSGGPIGTEIIFWAENLTSGKTAYTDPSVSGHASAWSHGGAGSADRVAIFDVSGETLDLSLYGGSSGYMTTGRSFLLFFETGNDGDHQDFVTLVQFVPAPAAAALGLLGVTGIAALRRRLA